MAWLDVGAGPSVWDVARPGASGGWTSVLDWDSETAYDFLADGPGAIGDGTHTPGPGGVEVEIAGSSAASTLALGSTGLVIASSAATAIWLGFRVSELWSYVNTDTFRVLVGFASGADFNGNTATMRIQVAEQIAAGIATPSSQLGYYVDVIRTGAADYDSRTNRAYSSAGTPVAYNVAASLPRWLEIVVYGVSGAEAFYSTTAAVPYPGDGTRTRIGSIPSPAGMIAGGWGGGGVPAVTLAWVGTTSDDYGTPIRVIVQRLKEPPSRT